MLIFEIPEIDYRLAKWAFMETPTLTIVIVLIYLAFVAIIGPEWMKRRQAYDLRMLMVAYNIALVVLSAYMFYKFGRYGWFHRYNWMCEEIKFDEDEESMEIVKVCWVFFISKFFELADTIFFVLRKKSSQVTFLHVVHHFSVPLFARFLVSRGSSGYNTLFHFMNSFVHIWMYLYYGLAAIGPGMQRYLWWKKYITVMQLIQFTIEFFFMVFYSVHPGCKVNSVLITINIGLAVFFFYLFTNFYSSSYNKRKLKANVQSSAEEKQ